MKMKTNTVGELIDMLSKFDRNKGIIVGGCYGAEGYMCDIEERKSEGDIFIGTDIFTG